MADKFPLANGVWSNAANWNGGTLPLAGDDVYADGKTVTIDQSVTVLSIRNTLRSGGTVGGLFNILTGGYTITCTDTLGIVAGVNGSRVITISTTTGTTNINTNLNAAVNGAGSILISGVGTYTVNFTGNISGGIGTNGWAINITGTPTLNIIGNLTTKSANNSHALLISNAAIIDITGDVNNASTVNGTPTIIQSGGASCSITVTGDVIGSLSTAIQLNGASTINITGNCTAQAATAISATSATVTVVGTITASNSAVGINVSSCTISTPCINSATGVNAVYSGNVKIYASAVASWLYKDELNNNKFLYSAGIALGNPAITNVRSGITYGASLELTGTMIVPSPSDVRISVPTDNTVGTGQLTAADFLAAIAASSDPIAVRLNNVSTVDTSGAQMASYNV